jgi:ubiquinone/menaquinone biosynthesis C-methylase UbiE
MNQVDRINVHDDFASIYDTKAKEYDSHGPEILFGMCYEYIRPGETILDLGIGTGLSSINFARAGLFVYGTDASANMLEECRKKGFAKKLKHHSIDQTPLPYSDNSFPFVICCGVFHFFAELQSFISEASRIVQPNGIFAFTIALPSPDEQNSISIDMDNYIEVQSEWDVSIFKHNDKYIYELMDTYNFQILKQQRVLAKSGEKSIGDIVFKTIITKK